VAELNTRLNATADELGEISRTLPVQQGGHTEATKALGMAQGREQQLLEDQEQLQSVRDAAVGAWRSFAATGLLSVALPDLEVPPADTPWAVEPAVRLARQTEAGLTEADDSDPAWKRVQDDITRRFTELAEALSRHGHQAQADLVEGRYVVTVLYSGRERSPAQLALVLADEIELRERELTGRERQVLEEHLVGDVAGRLQELITEADELVTWMNAELAERPTSTGMRLRLSWRPDPDGPEGLREARGHLLRQTSGLWSEEDRATVRDFLQRQIQRVRAEQPLGTWTEHLRQALDYRGWHAFVIERLQDGAWRPAIGPASGGERVLTVSLPLFAAASAHYRSAHPLAPRLVLLDEAFAGVDDDARAKCLGLLTQFDLDVAMTSEREWGFYPTVPGIAAYQLARHDGIDAVHVTAWEWDGSQPRQVVRPNLPPQAPERRSGRSKESKDEPEGLF
jgi:predicted transcriptional regulator